MNSKTLKIIAGMLTIYIIWGTTYLAIAYAVETIPAFLMAGGRFILAGGSFLAVLLLTGAKLPKRLHWRSAFIIGGLMLVGGNGFVTFAEQEIPSGLAALIVGTMPLWMTLFEWVLFKGIKPTVQVVLGLALGFVGIFVLIGPGQISGATNYHLPSLLILMCAPILWSLGSLYSRNAPLPDEVLTGTAMEMLAGGILLVIVGSVTGEWARFDVSAISTESLLSFFYLSLFGSIVAYSAYIWLLKNVNPSTVATYAYVNPVIAVWLGWALNNEPITAATLIAGATIIVSVILVTTGKKRTASDPPTSVTSVSHAAGDR